MKRLPREDQVRRDARITELTRAGMSARRIAELVGVTPRTVARVRARAGIAKPYTGANPMTDDEIRRAAFLLDDGASYGEVERTLGRSNVTIRKHLPGRSIWRPGGGQEIQMMRRQLAAIGGR